MTATAATDRLTRSHFVLLGLVASASFFEGYDFIILNLVLPIIQKEFNLSIQTTGLAVSAIAVGTIVAFFVIQQGDRLGRRPLLIFTVLGYTIATGLTAISQGIITFVIFQFLGRVFLVAEWGIATVIVAEELPARHRGWGIALVQAVAGVGGIVGGALFPLVEHSSFGWRAMYLVGLVPLIIVMILRGGMKETRRFREARATREQKTPFKAALAPEHRRNLILIALLWVFMYLSYTPVLTYWTKFAVDERGWSVTDVSTAVAVSYGLGLTGFLVAGKLMDVWGRRPTSILFFLAGAACTVWGFQAPSSQMGIALVFVTFFNTAYLTLCSTYMAELFPTPIRASAAAWTNNTLGRLGMVFAPTIVGLLATPLNGVGHAVSVMAIFPVLAAALIFFFLPETRQKELEEISA